MHVRCQTLLGIALAFTPIAAGDNKAAYSLEELQALARSVHPTLESAEAAIEAAAGGLRQARAYPNPEFAVGIGRGRPRDGGDARSEQRIELRQPVELAGVRRWRARIAELGVRGAEIDRDLAHIVVDATVASLVTTTLLEQRRAEVARESTDIASRLHALLARRVELGESSALEAVRARTEWFARRRDALAAERDLDAARSTLNLVCGDRLPAGFALAATLEGPGAIPLPADLAARLRQENPLVLRAGLAVSAADARAEAAGEEVFPRLDAFAGHVIELDRTATDIGIGLAIPLWNRQRGAIAEARADQARADADTRALTLELSTALGRASATYRGALAVIGLHQEGWTAAARKSLDIATFSFENGEASLLDLLDAQRSYSSVRLAEAEAWAELALARTDIERLIAGALEPENTDDAR